MKDLSSSMRSIVLDVETTGLDPGKGHRIIEIGCVELDNFAPTGAIFHTYINPQRDIPEDSFQIHALSTEFLKQHPIFQDIVTNFLEFISDSALIIHNAAFDINFLNSELAWIQEPGLSNQVIDTLPIARKKFPGSPASLSALCRRFGIDCSSRTKHGALLDAKLLAAVYLELEGGKQPSLFLDECSSHSQNLSYYQKQVTMVPRTPRSWPVCPQELEAHRYMLGQIQAPPWD